VFHISSHIIPFIFGIPFYLKREAKSIHFNWNSPDWLPGCKYFGMDNIDSFSPPRSIGDWGQANYSDKMSIHIKNLLESISILTGLI
jgi:hypothetical protein